MIRLYCRMIEILMIGFVTRTCLSDIILINASYSSRKVSLPHSYRNIKGKVVIIQQDDPHDIPIERE